MKKKLIYLPLLILPLSLEAERINIDKAYIVAENVLSEAGSSLRSSSDLTLAYKAYSNKETSLRASEQSVDFYVFAKKCGKSLIN